MNNEYQINKKLIIINIVLIIIGILYVTVSRIYFSPSIKETGTYQVEDGKKLWEFKTRQDQGYTVLINDVEYKTVSNITKVIDDYNIDIDNDNKHIIMTEIPSESADGKQKIIPVVIPISY